MGKTKIEWADYTWNPWRGCTKISSGCKNCYMYREQLQYGNDPTLVQRSKTTFHNPLTWNKLAAIDGKKYKTFTCSWSDFFIEEADNWREEAWDVIRQTPNLIYLILTKRPERIRQCLPEGNWFPRNVWWGVTIEDMDNLTRWDMLDGELHNYHPPVMFVSVEPFLSFVDFESIIEEFNLAEKDRDWWTRSPDWIIAGAESGPGARPMNMDWARSLRDQCVESSIPFFLKQAVIDGKLVKMPELDGKVWDQYPEISK